MAASLDVTKGTTSANTWIGALEAVGTGVADFFVHTPLEGGAFQQPTFYLGLLIAVCMGLRGYYSQGIPPAGQVMMVKPDPTPYPRVP